jgi:hypothetical protein
LELQARGRSGEAAIRFPVPEYFLRKSIRPAKELLAKLNNNDDSRPASCGAIRPLLVANAAIPATGTCRKIATETARKMVQ